MRALLYLASLIILLGGLLSVFSSSSQVYWLLLSALSWQMVYFSYQYPGFLSALAVIILTALGVLAGTLIQHSGELVCFVGLTTFITFYIGLKHSVLRSAMLFANVLLVLSVYFSGNGYEAGIKGIAVFVGALCTLFLFSVFYPVKVRLQLAIKDSLIHLDELASTVLMSLVAQDTIEKKYDYEKVLHNKRYLFLQALLNMQRLTKKTSMVPLIEKLQQAFCILQSVQLLALRIDDVTTFQVISKECYGLAQSVNIQIEGLIQRIYNHRCLLTKDDLFQDYIEQIEEIYQTALQVIAPDPAIFLLFIAELKEWLALIKQMRVMFNTMHVRAGS